MKKEKKEKNEAMFEVRDSKDILIDALHRAKDNGGLFLNADGRKPPRLIDGSRTIKSMDMVIAVAHSDNIGAKTNVYSTRFKAAALGCEVNPKEKGYSIQGVSYDGYQSKKNSEEKISVEEYKNLGKPEDFKPVLRTYSVELFNIDQTDLKKQNKEEYDKLVLSDAGMSDRLEVTPSDTEISTYKEDNMLRKSVNEMIRTFHENFIPIKRDDKIDVVEYDSEKNSLKVPPQYKYHSYPEYVQALLREAVAVTGTSQYLARPALVKKGKDLTDDMMAHEKLLVELVSASKMLEHSLPARISKENVEMIPAWIEKLEKEPGYFDTLAKDVIKTSYLINRAEQGCKLQSRMNYLKASSIEAWENSNKIELPSVKYTIAMLNDEKQGWVCMIKPDNEQPVIVKPTKEDIGIFFNQLKGKERGEGEETFRQQFAHKYYSLSKADPSINVDIYATVEQEKRDRINSVSVFRTKDTSKLLCVATIDGERQYPRSVSEAQYQVMLHAPKIQEYKLQMAAQLFADVLSQEKKEGVKIALPESYDKVALVANDDKTYTLYIKPGGQEGFGIKAEEKDARRFFVKSKQDLSVFDDFKNELANKYYRMSVQTPDLKMNIFPPRAEEKYSDIIDNVNIFKTKDSGKIFIMPTVQGVRLKPREITPGQFGTLLVSEDPKQYKVDLAARIFKEELDEKIAEKQKQSELAQSEKEQQREEEQTKQENAKTETKKPASEALSPIFKQYLDLKKKHPDALLLFRCGDFYETYQKDAEKASKILGITLTRSSKTKDQDGKPLAMAGFPYHALDTYLPKLIRAGERVAICDQIEAPKQTVKRSFVEEQEKSQQEEQKRSVGIHR